MSGKRRIAVIAVHPDDETLGAGGTLLRLSRQGAWLGWLTMTSMTTECGWPAQRVAERQAEVEKVAGSLGFADARHRGFRPAHLDGHPMADLIAAVRGALEAWRPDTVILPFWDDAHSDHKIAFQAAKACLKKFRAPYLRRVYAMEVLSETNFSHPGQFLPQVYSDISGLVDAKIEALSLYASEIQAHPFPRSAEAVRALATLRGSEAGFDAAEAFQLIAAYDGLG